MWASPEEADPGRRPTATAPGRQPATEALGRRQAVTAPSCRLDSRRSRSRTATADRRAGGGEIAFLTMELVLESAGDAREGEGADDAGERGARGEAARAREVRGRGRRHRRCGRA